MDWKKLKKLNLKQPKYVFPLILLPIALFLGYTLSQFFSAGPVDNKGVVKDSINMSLPEARGEAMEDKMGAMSKNFAEGGAFSAVDGIGDDVQQKDTTSSGYNQEEMEAIEREKAARLQQMKAEEELRNRQQANMNRINSYNSSGRSQQEDLNDYARELERIQNRSVERQNRYYADQQRRDKEAEAEERRQQQEVIDALTGNTKKKQKAKEKTEIVEKVQEKNAEKFNTVTSMENVDEPLIKAMIDKTTKAREGTRLRFKLLDDVTVKGIKLKKGAYLYGIVTGFGQQRVKANITSILVGNKFIKVNLSVFDNDGMEGFYVPESTFREMVKDAGSSIASQNIQFDTGGSTGISPEVIVLQALQNMYQSASSAVSKNIRKNKARIKYNTIVYLINTQDE
jgi:conjugative transposon TraM protein